MEKNKPGELGCYLSHLNVLKFLNTEEDWALICEDDIELDKDVLK